jgi:stress-induced-phosphoprotein 1
VNPGWSKGYARKGAALHGARRYDEALAAYEAGLKIEDSPALKKGLKEVQEAQREFCLSLGSKHMSKSTIVANDAAEGLGLGKMFADPNLIGKLAANPKTQKHLADPAFVQKVCSCPSLFF